MQWQRDEEGWGHENEVWFQQSRTVAQEARNGSDFSKAKPKKAKDTEKSSKPSSASGAKAGDGKHREKEQYSKSRAFPVFRDFSFTIDAIPSWTCDHHHNVHVL